MLLPFTGTALSWSHRGHVLHVHVHSPPGPPSSPDGPLVEWEALSRYLGAGAEGAGALLFTGPRGIDAGLCWSSLSGHAESAWSGLPGFVSKFGAAGSLTQLLDRVKTVWRAIDAFSAPSVAVVSGACARGGLEVASAVDRVVAERHPRLDVQLRRAGVAVDRWAEPGEGEALALASLLPPGQASMAVGSAQTSRQLR